MGEDKDGIEGGEERKGEGGRRFGGGGLDNFGGRMCLGNVWSFGGGGFPILCWKMSLETGMLHIYSYSGEEEGG